MNLKSIYNFFKSVDFNNNIVTAFTGDIDNLGLYVASNGRAKAECLVDNYNSLIEKGLESFCMLNNMQLLLSLSGEEIFGICIVRNSKEIALLSDFLKLRVNEILKRDSYYFRDDVTISFGIIRVNNMLLKDILAIIESEEYGLEEEKLLNKFIYDIRVDLIPSLDCEKFSTLPNLSEKALIFYRNLVYAKMMQYKRETRSTLEKISRINNCDSLIATYGNSYGVTEEQYISLIKLVEELKKL